MSKPGKDGGNEEYYQYSEDPDAWFKLPVHEESWSDETDEEDEQPTPLTPLTKRKRLKRRKNRFYKPWYSRGGTGVPPYAYTRSQPKEVTEEVAQRLNFDFSDSESDNERPFLPSGYSLSSSSERQPTSSSMLQESSSNYETFSGSERIGPRIVYRPTGYQSDIREKRPLPIHQRSSGRGMPFRTHVLSGPTSRRQDHFRQIASRPVARLRQRNRTRGANIDWGQNAEYDSSISERLDLLSTD